MSLPTVIDQARRLIPLGVRGLSEKTLTSLRDVVAEGDEDGGLLGVHPAIAPASTLAPLVEVNGRKGFIVADMGTSTTSNRLCRFLIRNSIWHGTYDTATR